MFQDLHVIDWHVHFPIFPATMREKSTARRQIPDIGMAKRRAAVVAERAQWRDAWDFPEPETERRTWEAYVDLWHAEAVMHGLDRVVFVTGPDNDTLTAICRRHPETFVGLAHHDPCQPDAAVEFERAIVELGLRGYKMLAPLLDWRIDDERYYPIWEIAARHNVPVLFHFGMQGGAGGIAYNEKISPVYLERPAKDFPEVNFVVPHFGKCGALLVKRLPAESSRCGGRLSTIYPHGLSHVHRGHRGGHAALRVAGLSGSPALAW